MRTPRIAVAGAGPVGLAFACAMRREEIVIYESAGRAPELSEAFDSRIFALSPGTRAFLRDIGAWELLDSDRTAVVRRMEVFGDAGAKLSFSGRAGQPLAWIVEAGRLAGVLEAAATALPNIAIHRGRAVTSARVVAGQAALELEGGDSVLADLLVGADGPDSRVRSLLGLATEVSAYGETAIVANFETAEHHADCARQWFRNDGVLAWLPLPGRRISIVWSAPEGHAQALATLSEGEFEQRVRDAGASVLGKLRLVSRPVSFPLRAIHVTQPVAEGVALIGDAAHAVHPLAGQGVNLGFQDARLLAEELSERSALERPGDLRVLRRYARARKEDVTAMQFVTRRLDQLFASQTPGASAARNAGLRLVESQPWMKGLLSGRAMR